MLTLGRGLAILGPQFTAVRARAAGPVTPLDRAQPVAQPIQPGGALSPIFSSEVRRWGPFIERWSVEYSLPADLIAVVMQIESCGDPMAVSSAGALGLFQVMPYHFAQDDDPFDVETNAARGLSYLTGSMRLASGDPRLALAGYNGGHTLIGRTDTLWADETQRYVTWGVGILQDSRNGEIASPWLASWLASGGEQLCRQAAQRWSGE